MDFKNTPAPIADTSSIDSPTYGHWAIVGNPQPMRVLVTGNWHLFPDYIDAHPQMRFLYWRAQ
jgi:hypothetical protein